MALVCLGLADCLAGRGDHSYLILAPDLFVRIYLTSKRAASVLCGLIRLRLVDNVRSRLCISWLAVCHVQLCQFILTRSPQDVLRRSSEQLKGKQQAIEIRRWNSSVNMADCASNQSFIEASSSLESPNVWLNAGDISQTNTINDADSCDLLSVLSSWNTPVLNSTSAENAELEFNQLILPEPDSADINFSLADSIPPMIERTSQHTLPPAASVDVSNNQSSFTLNDSTSTPPISFIEEFDICRSSSPSTFRQLLPAQKQRDLSPNHTRVSRSTKQRLRWREPSTTTNTAEIPRPIWSETPSSSSSSSSQESEEERIMEKRRRNKLAAQRLRQRKMDQVSGLESRLEQVTKERDDLRLRAAKWEGEAMALRKLLDQKNIGV